MASLKSFLLKAAIEFLKNGKLLAGYVVQAWPGITDYPGLLAALNAFAEHASLATLWPLLFQIFLAGAAGHRLVKILQVALAK